MAMTKTHMTANEYKQLLFPLVPSDGELVTAPDDVYLDALNIIQPDMFLILRDNGYLDAAPDLVCEVLSPETAKNNRNAKFDLYEKRGVREYWLIDAANQWIEVFAHQEGKLVLVDLYHKTTFTSPLLQQVIDTNLVFTGVFS